MPKDGWEMAALAIGLGGGELWVQDGLLLILALSFVACQARLYQKNNGEKLVKEMTDADEKRSLCNSWLQSPMPTKVWAVP